MEISWYEIKDNFSNIKIIDIRENYLFNLFRIKNSINIPYPFLITNPSEYLNKNDDYYLVCDFGHKSKMVSEILNKNGFKTNSLIGGLMEYENLLKKQK